MAKAAHHRLHVAPVVIAVFAAVLTSPPSLPGQILPSLQMPGRPDVRLSVSPQDPTTKDQITFTVAAEDTGRTGLKRIVLLIDDREVKSCLTSPCVYFGGPFPEGTFKFAVMVYDHTASDPATVFKMITVRKPSTVARGSVRTLDLLRLAEDPRTRWTDGTIDLTFPGEEDGLRTFACTRYDADLEDGSRADRVLLTRPRPTEAGAFVVGVFDLRDLPGGSAFRARVGFLSQPDETDSAEFRVFVAADPSRFAARLCFYDGRLDELVLDLDRYAGEDIELVLQVRALEPAARHLAVWIDPRVVW